MDVLVTKCCMAEPVVADRETGTMWCRECGAVDPHVEYEDWCDGCNRFARYCECP